MVQKAFNFYLCNAKVLWVLFMWLLAIPVWYLANRLLELTSLSGIGVRWLKTKHSQTFSRVWFTSKCIAIGRENYYLDPSCKKDHRGTSKVHLLPVVNNWNELRLAWMCVFWPEKILKKKSRNVCHSHHFPACLSRPDSDVANPNPNPALLLQCKWLWIMCRNVTWHIGRRDS